MEGTRTHMQLDASFIVSDQAKYVVKNIGIINDCGRRTDADMNERPGTFFFLLLHNENQH